MNDKTITVDVRDDIRNGHEPFSRIMSAVSELRDEERLLLIAPFEPVPLCRVMETQGYAHVEKETASGDWEVLFTRQHEAQPIEVARNGSCNGTVVNPTHVVNVDARGLEPPQPMVKILEALSSLPPGAELRARTDRRPMHLYTQLEARGFVGETEEQSDGSFITHIGRA